MVFRPVRHGKVEHFVNGDSNWMQVAALMLVISFLVNVFTIGSLYKHNALGVSASRGIDFSHNGNEFEASKDLLQSLHVDSQDRHIDYDTLDYDLRHLSSSSQSSASNTASTNQQSSTNQHSSTNHGSAGHGSGGDHHSHQHDSLLYIFNALVVGAAIMQLNARFPMLQQTVLLFVVGFLFSLLLSAFNLSDEFGVFGGSYDMWMDIDPHLLLFTLLPALLAGDAMTIDTFVAKKVFMQCLWLAGPGVLVGGFSCALFLRFYLDWDFWLCLCAGAILCATDPVAVVALLKELGASPMLTVQIQGESLLNDGTAIVLYLISYELLRGETFEWTDVAEFLIKKAMMAWALGLFIGYFFFCWIWFASNKLEHSSSMIQISLTLICAYWSFIFVEGVLTLSGVLATVAASLVLAAHMWPHVAFPESMHHVWHTFESLGNIVIFVLAGSITGKIVVNIDAIDYLHLLVIYVVLLVIRAVLIFGCRPILSYLSMVNQPVSWQDAAVMTWGGLRGAVGLALAISVRNDRAPDICTGVERISQKDAERLLFYVSGIAFLTMVVNATTAPFIVNALGITATPEARKQLLRMFHDQLVRWSIKGDSPEEVTCALQHMLDDALGEINHQKIDSNGPKVELKFRRNTSQEKDESQRLRTKSKISGSRSRYLGDGVGDPENFQTSKDLVVELEKEKQMTRELLRVMFDKTEARDDYDLALRLVIGDDLLAQDSNRGHAYMATRLPGVNKENPFGDVEGIKKLLSEFEDVDIGMAKVINKSFMELVSHNYWSLIDAGSLRAGPESEILFTSVRVCLSPYRADLCDYAYIEHKLLLDSKDRKELVEDEEEDTTLEELKDDTVDEAQRKTKLGQCVGSWKFNLVVMVAILLNSVQVIFEEVLRDNCTEKCGESCQKKDIDDHVIWLVLDAIFTAFFTIEFMLKFAWLCCGYFRNHWNKFDFFLVAVGIFGLVASIVTHGQEADLASQTRLIRVARVLRTLRFLRIFRLFHARMSADKYVSMSLASRMKTLMILNCFITAQLQAQVQLIEFFGGNGEVDEEDECELGRCILQSQVHVYRALYAAAWTHHQMGEKMTKELDMYRKRKRITEGLRKITTAAQAAGALSATETHAILHPLDHEVAHCIKVLSQRQDGFVSSDSEEHRPSHKKQHSGHLPRPLQKTNSVSSATSAAFESQQTVLAIPMTIGVPEPPSKPAPSAPPPAPPPHTISEPASQADSQPAPSAPPPALPPHTISEPASQADSLAPAPQANPSTMEVPKPIAEPPSLLQ